MNATYKITHPHLNAEVACPYCAGKGYQDAENDFDGLDADPCDYCGTDGTAVVSALFANTTVSTSDIFHVDHETVLELMDNAGLDWEAFA